MAQDPLSLVCIEPRFPGRLGAVADWLVRRRGYRCQFYCAGAEPKEHWPAAVGRGLEVIGFPIGGVARESAVAWTRGLERGLCYAYGCYEVLDARRPRPVHVVLGRSAGLGSTLFAPVALPGVPVVNLFEYFYAAHAHDLAEEAGSETPAAYFHWRQSANAMDLLDLENGVTPWVPTRWQRDLYPPEYHDDFVLLHDGIDTRRFRPQHPKPRQVAGRTIPAGARVVSFVARALDRVRGFDRFVSLANELLRGEPNVLCLVVGAATVQRGLDVWFFNRDYRAHVLGQAPLHDPERVWFLDTVPPAVVAEVLAASDLHIYPSRPYPVARSLLEAMASGCVVLAGDEAPVREVVTQGRTGLLVPPADLDGWVRTARAVLADPAGHRPLGEAATEEVRRQYSHDATLPWLAEVLDHVAAGGGSLSRKRQNYARGSDS
jgi:glycosyltransferase involved in cell wall biosynthesis